MSFLNATPDIVSTAATDLAGIASNLGAANSAAAASTTGVLPAALDEVSTEVAALFGAHGQAFQALSVRAAAFHEHFVQLLGGGASAYANAEANIVQALTSAAPGSAQAIVPATVLQSIEAAAADPPQSTATRWLARSPGRSQGPHSSRPARYWPRHWHTRSRRRPRAGQTAHEMPPPGR